MSYWTEQRVAHLQELWIQGFSVSRIAAALGDNTRNSVIGKVHRLGLDITYPRSRGTLQRRYPRAKKKKKTQPRLTYPRLRAVVPRRCASALPLLPPPARRLTLVELRDADCRWLVDEPSEEPNLFYCGAPVLQRSSYCEYHAALVYRRQKEG